jgi:hypothetical protein
MQIIAVLLVILALYATFDTTPTDTAQSFEDQADGIAKQLEFYHAQAVNCMASPPLIGCGQPKMDMAYVQAYYPELKKGAWYQPDAFFASYTDGTYIVTTWQAPPAELAADPAHLYGTIAAILKRDSDYSFKVGAYNASTGVVGGGLYLTSGGALGTSPYPAFPMPFQGVVVIPDGAPVLVSKL